MSVDAQRTPGTGRVVAEARPDRQYGVAPIRNDVKSRYSYRPLDHYKAKEKQK